MSTADNGGLHVLEDYNDRLADAQVLIGEVYEERFAVCVLQRELMWMICLKSYPIKTWIEFDFVYVLC